MQELQRQLDRAEIEGKIARVAEIEAKLSMPPFPEPLDYLWRAYLRLRHRMAGGFSGPNPVGWQDIDAFIRRSGTHLAPWEIDILERVDDVFLHPEEIEAASSTSRPMSEQLFDTIFS